ncbi:MAG: GntR family transcriptional regulator [Thermoleophilia bacterium]|nr:GntR family transcriptional regulator [Thermoleophilia bacterium]
MDEVVGFELARGAKPLHAAIAEHLADLVASGSLTPGTRLPPERQLATTLGVSRMTVRQALGELERDGLVRRVVGRAGGTFVSETPGAKTASGAGGVSAALRRAAGASHAELVSAEIEPAGKRTAAALGLGRDERVVVIARLRLAGGKPLAVERTSLPSRLFPDMEDMDLAGSLYDLMDVGFGLRPVRATERLEVAVARPSDARTIGAKRGTSVLLVERVGYAADGTPIEFSRDRFRADRTWLATESTQITE